MTTPNVSFSKNVFTTSQAPAASTGILAVVAASSTGTVNQPAGFARSDLAVNAVGYGPLSEYGAYDINTAQKPFVAVKGNATYAGSYGAVSLTRASTASTASVTASGTSFPYDHYAVDINITVGGTVGVDGIQYTYSVDDGNVTSGAQALGTANVLSIPNTGVAFNLGVGTLVTGDVWTCRTERPLLNDTDITNAMTALGTTRLPFEGVLVDCSAGQNTVSVLDGILSGWEARGLFKFFVINSRYKNEPEPSTESEAAYATALTARFGAQTSIRGCVGADGAHVPSPITGWSLKRPTSMLLATRAMQIPIGEDPAYVGRGPLSGASIDDAASNPLDHDEDLYPTLDSLRLTSLRSFAQPSGPQGVYICNANTIQPSGGAFPYLQHIRIMNRACEIAWFILTRQLSLGVRKNPKPDPVTKAVTIFEPDAAAIEALVQPALLSELNKQISGVNFSISRTDDLSQVPAKVNATLSIVALAYIKGFVVQSQFVKTLSTSV